MRCLAAGPLERGSGRHTQAAQAVQILSFQEGVHRPAKPGGIIEEGDADHHQRTKRRAFHMHRLRYLGMQRLLRRGRQLGTAGVLALLRKLRKGSAKRTQRTGGAVCEVQRRDRHRREVRGVHADPGAQGAADPGYTAVVRSG